MSRERSETLPKGQTRGDAENHASYSPFLFGTLKRNKKLFSRNKKSSIALFPNVKKVTLLWESNMCRLLDTHSAYQHHQGKKKGVMLLQVTRPEI